ncbi:MAG: sulfite exporter TauE/SafE family protein [Phycisphaerae bacterium]|jgi:uncharacterized membrane protein YfcA
MPALFPDIPSLVACVLIMAGAQLIYATVGFGAGMFAVSLMAMLLPDLAGVVSVLVILTLVTEVWVLAHAWRQARPRLLLTLLPGMVLGLVLGTQVLVAGNAAALKRVLGLVVLAAGVWFFCERNGAALNADATPGTIRRNWWLAGPVGFISGVLGGMYGTGGPPVIVYLRSCRLDKGAFRATILWFFMTMSVVRGGVYVQKGILTADILLAAAWLLPGSLTGIVAGMAIHRSVSERQFARGVAVLLVVLGGLLLVGTGR